jgi:uncharacterized membrane protein
MNEINAALETTGAGDLYVLIILALLLFWSGVVLASSVIGYFWVRETWRRFAGSLLEEDDDEDFDAGATPIGYQAPHTDEMGWTEYVEE